MLRFCPLATVLIGLPLLVQAQVSDPSFALPDVTVYPERDLLLEPTRESAALDLAVTEMPPLDLRRLNPPTAGEALKFAPGIHSEVRGRKYKQMLSFRGQVYPYPDLAFDGLWLREAREVPYVFPARALERIELVRSSSTLLFGLADVVGVINLVPVRPSPSAETPPIREAGMEVGELGMVRASGLYEFRGTEGGMLAGGQFYRTDGRTGRNAAEELSSLFGAWVYQPDDDTRFEAGGYVLHGFRELEVPDPDGPAQNSLKNRKERYDPLTYTQLQLRGFHRGSDRTSTEWSVYVTDRQARYRQQVLAPEAPPFRDTEAGEDDREYAAQVIQALGLTPHNTLRLGVFAHRWTAPDGKQSYVGARQDVASYAVVLTDEQRAGPWTFDGGFRFAQSFLRDFSGPAFDVSGASTQSEAVRNTWDDPVVSATLGAAVDLDARNRLHAHVGFGQRRSGPGAVRSDGTRPDTERRITSEGGWSLAWGQGAEGRLRLGGFLVLRQDAVTRTDETGTDARGQEFYFSDNRDLRQCGIEAEIATPWIWRDRLQAVGSLTWMTSEARDPGGSYGAFDEVPSVIASAGLRAAAGDWDAGLFAKHVSAYENSRFAQGGVTQDLGDYVDITLTAGLRVGRQRDVRLYVAVDNLFDDTYSTVVGWSDPGRRFRGGLEVAF